MKYLYKSLVRDFINLAQSNQLAALLSERYLERYGRRTSPQEVTSWDNSLKALAEALSDARLADAAIFLELQMPLSSARCDVMLVGQDEDNVGRAVIIELKQWQHLALSAVLNSVSVGEKNYQHPSAQAKGYTEYLRNLSEAFSEHGLEISGCSFLHNMSNQASIGFLRHSSFYSTLLREYPAFTAGEEVAFRNYLVDRVGNGNGAAIAEIVANSGIKPSTKLLDVVAEAVKSNYEWVLLDAQLDVFNTVVSRVEEARSANKKSLIVVRGGPGTGKSVLAIQLLAYAARQRWRVAHVCGSKAFITVLQGKTQAFADTFYKKIYNARYTSQLPVKELFTTFATVAKLGSEKENELDLVVGDEAHRLWDFRRVKYSNINKQLSTTPMIEELLNASKVTALFLDDNQAVRADEIGSVDYILDQAHRLNIDVEVIDLTVQFRLAGSQSYMDWIDHVLSFKTENSLAWTKFGDYDFRIVDSMEDMQKGLGKLLREGNRCRLVAGFCWKWSNIEGNGGLIKDIRDPRFGNWSGTWIEKGAQDAEPLESRYYKWAVDDTYYNQVGSIYSVQGFEFDYIGVIVGEDLVWRKDHWEADLSKNKDNTFKKDLQSGQEDPVEKLRNIYRVLLTRGMRGTFVYFLDAETRQHFEDLIEDNRLS